MNNSLKRRKFLGHVAGAFGLASLPLAHAAEAPRTKALPRPLEELVTEMETKGRNMLSVPRQDGEFLQLLVKATGAKNALEIGTSQGYSTFWIARGLQETGGKLTTVEILPERVQLAKRNLARAGLDKSITFKEGDAHKVVSTLEGPFDFVFIDADKQGQVDYFNNLFPKRLAPGGSLVAHNAIKLKDMMEDYLKLVGEHPQFDSVILSITMDDGFAVSYRHRT